MKLKKGDEYESLIQYLYQTLSEDSGIQVFSKYKIKGKSKVEHEIDVYYEFLKNDVIHRVIIECKDWNTKVVKEKIEALKAKIDDIPNSVGIIVSKKGLQKGAKEFAEYHGIKIVVGDKISILNEVLKHRLKIVLPDQNTKAEPFWTIMEKDQKGNVTGSYIKFQDRLILFISKKEAEETIRMSERTDACVVGITKRHLNVLIKFSETWNCRIAIKNFLMDTIIEVSPEQLRDNFYSI
jgi:hypothetical protein